ncbi:DEAD/DEAH box helicase [Succinatimonas hippei]|uniref:DEAD/DEAH box helicase n=1 Tax=Succinatimonas hippei TaxID=626938 RepID=UPI00248FE763|nr:DEAD/DEAH box helicase [Succinatimonas hippei]
MTDFINKLIKLNNYTFHGMRETAISLLPKNESQKKVLYDALCRGKTVLSEDELNMYLFSYGKMHEAKLHTAFSKIPLSKWEKGSFEVYDWGCGQGTASICLLDFLSQKGIKAQIEQITLIEPSIAGIERAASVLKLKNPIFKLCKINKDFNSLSEKDFSVHNLPRLHLFSNILDVESFDLIAFIHLFQTIFSGNNSFICVGPYYSNVRRMDEFTAALQPDVIYANDNLRCGEWLSGKDWSMSLRVFTKDLNVPESTIQIQNRIENLRKNDQFCAGFILDAVAEESKESKLQEENEHLLYSLSFFNVTSNRTLLPQNTNPQLAVLCNIISRGLPTKAPVLLEEIFRKHFDISQKPADNETINYVSKHKITAKEINEALHIIDPRFTNEYYNYKLLQSSFEKAFITDLQQHTQSNYLLQILEPQRSLSTLIEIPNEKFTTDQCVDFALEIPYGQEANGFIVEIDGAPYHSNLIQHLYDQRRDRLSNERGFKPWRINNLEGPNFLNSWQQNKTASHYLSVLRENYNKTIVGHWKNILQQVLSPFAVARIERMILEAFKSNTLKISDKLCRIAIIERDVPAAAIAIRDLEKKLVNIYELSNSLASLPKIELTIVSTPEFISSPLHLGHQVHLSLPNKHFDLCIDLSMLLRTKISSLPINADADTIYIIRSAHYKQKERTVSLAENICYPALVEKDEHGIFKEIQTRVTSLTYFLRDIFRKPSFRQGQIPILSRALTDKTTIGLLPTGGGKSLTYQLACLLQPGIAIIVDPLVSLMVDQVRGLRELRIDSCDCVNSSMNAITKEEKLNLLKNGEIQFMLLSPERFMMPNFRSSLQEMTQKNHIHFSYGVIDEVHCISEWGHDFRPSYLHLGRNMATFMHTKSGKNLSIIGLTATASFDVLADVERELTLGSNLIIDNESIIHPESDNRPELIYRIIRIKTQFNKLQDSREPAILHCNNIWDLRKNVSQAKFQVLCQLIQNIPEQLDIINNADNNIQDQNNCHIPHLSVPNFYCKDSQGKYTNAGIIFCPHAHGSFGVLDSSSKTLGFKTLLQSTKKDLKLGSFIGGDNPSGDMRLFNDNTLNIMVATKAFGMGIDKPNIRYTININHPSSIESFVQEAGRAGRDKKHAISYVLYDDTQFIYLSEDKIFTICKYFDKNPPSWLRTYVNCYILYSEFDNLCAKNGSNPDQISKIKELFESKEWIENVDKDIILWFHHNSFRGLFKEKVILTEMVDNILNIKPTVTTSIQNNLRQELGNNDLKLIVNKEKNSITIVSQNNIKLQYGYLFLNNLFPIFKYTDFPLEQCQQITQTLINILQKHKINSATEMLRPLYNSETLTEGIYKALEQAAENDTVYVKVSWENIIKQDFEQYEDTIRNEIKKIAHTNDWNDIPSNSKFSLNRIGNFEELLFAISKESGDIRWLHLREDSDIYRILKLKFCKIRDKDDTDKAIYRMCCIGLVEDVTIDYFSQTYELKIKKQKDDAYRQHMLNFFRKYYSQERALSKVDEIPAQKGRNYLDKCLGYLTKFVYENLERKRWRAIEDMRNACQEFSIKHDSETDNRLKEFIHLYFNSKYARVPYFIDTENYSLAQETNEGCDDFTLVRKYIDVIEKDPTGSEIDNIKHLYGAVLLCLRAHTDNPALLLLLTYCIAFLGTGDNSKLKTDLYNNYINGFMYLYKNDPESIFDKIYWFNNKLKKKSHPDDKFVQEQILSQGKQYLSFLIHENEFNNIAQRYIQK